MNRRKGLYQLKNRFIMLMIGSMLSVCCLNGCGKEAQESAEPQEEVMVEESVAVQQSVEEEKTAVEESTEEAIVEEELSDEEWFESLNLTDARFMIFNDITGERKLLENGQQYTLLEGDELAFWFPIDEIFVELNPSILYNDIESKFTCVFIDLNYDQIGNNSELILHVEDADGNDVYATIYLSK